MFIKLIMPMTYESSELQAGEIMEITQHSGEAAIAEGRAIEVDDAGNDVIAPPEEPKDEAPADDEAVKLYAAIDDKYNRDDLAEAAKKLDVEFKYNAKKAEIINAVIAAEKGDAILAL